MRLYFALLTLFLPISSSQRQRWHSRKFPRACTGRQGLSNCFAPAACRTGLYESQEYYYGRILPFCCYSLHSRYVSHGEWSLDCRTRDLSNLARTDTSSNVVELDLSFNNLANYASRLRDDFLKHFNNLTSLRIEISHLDSLPPDFLSAHAKLKIIVLAWNDISELPEDLFANNPKLYDVNLRDNQITHIPNRLFRNNPEIWSLQISGNSLTKLTQQSLRYLPDLSVFDASNNDGLKCMSFDLFRYNTRLKFVRLDNIGPFIPKNVQRVFCDGGGCPYTIRHFKYMMRMYRYLYQCRDERDGRLRYGETRGHSLTRNF